MPVNSRRSWSLHLGRPVDTFPFADMAEGREEACAGATGAHQLFAQDEPTSTMGTVDPPVPPLTADPGWLWMGRHGLDGARVRALRQGHPCCRLAVGGIVRHHPAAADGRPRRTPR
jgi:hypothetical protein